MRGLNRILSCGLLFCSVAVSQEGPTVLRLPTPRERRVVGPRAATQAPAPAPAPAFDPVFRYGYGNKREAAAAALLAGNDAENIGRNRERALGFFMMSIERDPTYARALFNLGVMSAKGERWDDALNFYREARRLDTEHQISDAIEAETLRVDMIARLEATPDGRRQRQFDIQLTELIALFGDPVIALDRALKLEKADPGRWEAPAAAGIMQAALAQYDDSAKSLDAAVRLAPADWRPKLTTAGDLARQEGQYIRLVQEADAAAEKNQYESAAKLYADAWQASPARVQTGMRAAVAFLMADQISLAVQTLSRLRQVGTPEISEKAGLMLKELGDISADAKTAALQTRSGDAETVVDVAERVRTTLGDLRSPEMKLSASPNPPLLSDGLKFIHVSDDQINNPSSDLLLISSQSLFTTYQARVGAIAAPTQFPEPVSAPAPPSAAPSAAPLGNAPPQDSSPSPVLPARPQRLSPVPYTPPSTPAPAPSDPPPAF